MYVCMYEFLLVQHYLMEDYYDVFKTLTVSMYVCMDSVLYMYSDILLRWGMKITSTEVYIYAL